jgi:diguanylate cyclase (GGDEF)-like protein/PAS domain S-box-containing protein
MREPPLQLNESARLAALQRYEILDTKSEVAFDVIAKLAADICGASVASIGLIDQNRLWFKSIYGLTLAETPRASALCAHAIAQNDLFEVPDLNCDERFRHHPLTAGEFQLRFYASAPLRTPEGHALGTLCVMDQRTRTLTEHQRSALKSLAVLVMNLLEGRLARSRVLQLGSLLDQSDNEIYTFDADTLRFVYASAGACRSTGYSLGEILELTPLQLQPGIKLAEFEEAMQQLNSSASASVVFESECVRKDSSSYPVQARIQLSHAFDRPLVLGVVTNISERVQAQHDLATTHERLRNITDSIPALIAYVNREMRYEFFNHAYQEWFGRDKLLNPGMHMADVLGEVYERALPNIQRCFGGETVSFEVSGVQMPGLPEHAIVNYLPHRNGDEVLGCYVLVFDISTQKRAEEALFREKELLSVTLQSIGDAVITTDVEGKVTYMNTLAEALTGWVNANALGKPLPEILVLADGATKVRAPDPIMMALATNSASGLALNTVLVRADGAEIPIEDSASPIHDRSGNVVGGVLVFRDISATQAMAVKMTHLAQHDLLTHLPNRLLLKDRVSQALGHAARRGKRAALLFLDLDRFKHINDSLGHAIGDKLLQHVAQRLLGCVRVTDTVCRQGGDEFVVLLSEIEHLQQASLVADKLLRSIALPYVIDGHELHISLSMGISIYPDDAQDPEALARNADTAMYHAKEQGRANYQFFTAELNERTRERASLESSLRQGLGRNEFILHYQPKISISTGQVVGAEALLRWQHPHRGLILPDQFIGVAEDAGMIVRLGQWVMNAVCEQIATWRSRGFQTLPIAINISGAQIRDKNFFADLSHACSDHAVSGKLLELELTESVLMQDREATAELLNAVKRMGLRLSIDDFGTGYSSLSYLKRFPIDALKIDRSFVRDISTDVDDAAIVSAIISMAKSLKQMVIAEGVETQAQLEFLREQRCDQMQGYLFSRPVEELVLAQMFFRRDS